jgi:predicted ATPase
MFTEVQIENYKSIQSLKINLGRVNVFIGENGCGKSNILEAIALAAAAAGNKLDNEFLYSRGIRVTEPKFMRSAFDKENIVREIRINVADSEQLILNFVMQHDNKPYSNWTQVSAFGKSKTGLISQKQKTDVEQKSHGAADLLIKVVQDDYEKRNGLKLSYNDATHYLLSIFENKYPQDSSEIRDFMIYSPENSSLRIFNEEGQIQPLGTKGEGLLKLLRVLNNSSDKIYEIKKRLELIDWFDDFKVPHSDLERIIEIKDRYLDKELPYFNQRSSNEGFLFLMFYFALFVSDDTPKFFAIDNIENALNPKLCTRLIQELVELAKKYDKQVIFTTHNPAILDGLDLSDDEQRLFTIYRNVYGHTKVERIFAPQPLGDEEPVLLSEAFMNGYIGGLPDNF